MKKLLLILLSAASVCAAQAPTSELSETMTTYRDGCLKMLEALRQQDKFSMYEAKELFARVDIDWLKVPLRDPAMEADADKPDIWFCTEYADRLLRNNFEFIRVDEASPLRTFATADLLVLHQTVRPGKSLEYAVPDVSGHCEAMLLAASGDGLLLSVTDSGNGRTYEGHTDRSTACSSVVWEMSAPEREIILKVENPSDEAVSFVLAIN